MCCTADVVTCLRYHCSLRRYRYPTDDMLREAAGLAKNGKKKGKQDEKQDSGFLVPKNADFQVRQMTNVIQPMMCFVLHLSVVKADCFAG